MQSSSRGLRHLCHVLLLASVLASCSFGAQTSATTPTPVVATTTQTAAVTTARASVVASPTRTPPPATLAATPTITPRPVAVEAQVGDALGDVKPRDPITLTFSAPMDQESVARALALQPAVPGQATWQGNVLTYTPSQAWPVASLVSLTLAASAKTASGASLGSPFDWSFATAVQFDLVQFSPANQATYVPQDAVINLIFSDAPDRATVSPNVSITPAVEGAFQQDGRTATFVPKRPLPLQTTFTIHVGTGVRDANGQSLHDATSWQFTTQPEATSPEKAVYPAGGPTVFVAAGQTPQLAFSAYGLPSVHLSVYRVPSISAFVKAYAHPTDVALKVDPSAFTAITSADVSLASTAGRETQLVTVPGISSPGVYYVAESTPNSSSSGQFLVVSARGVVLKQSGYGALAWVTTLSDGQPVPGVPVQVFDAASGTPLGSGTTDADGLIEQSLALKPPPRGQGPPVPPNVLVVAGGDADFTLAGSNYEFYASGFLGVPRHYQAYVYTERPIYRPGDVVHVRGIVRADDDVHYSLPANVPVRLLITSPIRGDAIVDRSVTLDANGSFATDVPLAAGLPTGYYGLTVDVGSGPASPLTTFYAASFQVEAYRKPEYAVSVSVPDGPFASGDQIPVMVSARYYFNQPVKGGKLTVNVTRSAWYEPYQPGATTQVDPEAAELGTFGGAIGGTHVLTRTATLDDTGMATVTVPADLGTLTQSQEYGFEATVTDAANNPVTGTASAVVHRGGRVLFVEPRTYAVQTDTTIPTVFTVHDLSQQPQGGVPIQCNVFQQTYDVTQEGTQKGATPFYNLVEVLAYRFQLQSGADGKASMPVRLPRASGYRLSCTVTDARSNVVTRDVYLWASSSAGALGPYAVAGNRLTVGVDKQVYAVGDVARLQLLSPVADVAALVTVERGKIYRHQVVKFSGKSATLDLPVTADDVPNVAVSVSVQGRDVIATGSATLRVPAMQRYLNVTVKADKAQYQPGDTATLTLSATDASGQPAQGVFSVGVVDEAIYALVRGTPASIKGSFYAPQPAAVLTAASLAASPATTGPGGRGGGGGGQGGAGLRSDFADTAYWSPNVHTGPDGTATVKLTLPDSLTTWRITAIGATAATQVGYVTAGVVSTKPFHVRPVLPRFLTSGDQVSLGAIVDNAASAAVTATVTLSASDRPLASQAAQQALVPAGGSALLRWTAKVGGAGQAKVTMRAVAGDVTDGAELTLPVLPGGMTRSVDRSGEVSAGTVDATLDLPSAALPGSASLDLAITPSLAAGIQTGAAYLAAYPYGCAEQVASSFLPAILAKEAYAKAGLTGVAAGLPANLDAQVAEGLQRLSTLQHADGGWNWWTYDQTDPYMTAYVVYTLAEAKRLGYPVVESSLQAGVKSLQSQLNAPAAGLSTRAYMLYVLAMAGQPVASISAGAKDLLSRTGDMAFYGQSYLAEVLQMTGDQADARRLTDALAQQATQTQTSASWKEHISLPPLRGSLVYSTAAALDAFTSVDPSNPLALKAARFLLASRAGAGWQTTHDSAVALMALNRYLLAHGDLATGQHYQVFWNGQMVKDVQVQAGTASAEPVSLHLPAAQVQGSNSLRITSVGASPLFWSASLGYRVAAGGATGADVRVSRAYLLPNGSPVRGPLAVGTVVQVLLTVQAPAPLDYVLVADQLPSGLEPLNPELATTQAQQTNERPPGYDRLDLLDSEAAFFITGLPAGTHTFSYFARADTPGTFQAPPARAWQMYTPTVSGTSEAATVTITP